MVKKQLSSSAFRVCTALILPVVVMIGCAESEDVALDTSATITPMQNVFAADSGLVMAIEQREAVTALASDRARGVITPVAEVTTPITGSDPVLYFATDDDKVANEDISRLSQIAEYLTQHPGSTVQINGHADERGTRAHNEELSLRRAQQVAAALASFGVPSEQIQTAGYGEDRPAADPAQWDKNRRVELEYVDPITASAQ